MSGRTRTGPLPTGTVTFLFTDIEDSTTVLQHLGDEAYGRLLARHHDLVRGAIAGASGIEVASEGDSFFAVFGDPLQAVEAALSIQALLASPDWDLHPIRLRIGLHTGNGVLGGDDYVGVDVHLASRISQSGNGGQVVLSDVTSRLLHGRLPDGVSVEPLGRYKLAGFAEPISVLQLRHQGATSEFPPLRATRAESRLPVSLTEFIGRDIEIGNGLDVLNEHRLLTLTGPGGTGKTRLSLEIARCAEDRFADGAYFVPLAPLTDSTLIPMTIIDSLGMRTAGGVDPLEHISKYLSAREVLLILDNFEQLLDGVSLVSTLLASSPGLAVIVTSRSPLRIAGEREMPVPPLAVPSGDFDPSTAGAMEGVRLFVKRAEAVRPDFTLTSENAPTVIEIARSLDGLPLAIELAASRLRSLTPELILDRLGNQLLVSQSPDVPARQQTIVNAIGWSYDLLEDSWKGLFEQLSVFSGSFGLTEAEEVCGSDLDVLDGVAELVENSLIRPVSTSGEPRYRMLTVIREFAYAALVARGEDVQLADRHAAVYSDLGEIADSEILTSRQKYWLGRLSQDHDNFRAAFDHSIARGDAATALRIAGSLWRFWQIRGHLSEGLQRIESALDLAGDGHELARARALTGLGGLLYWKGDWEGVLGPYEQALELFREFGAEDEVAEALYNSSFPIGYAGDLDRAKHLLRESLELSEQIGRGIGVGRANWGIANMAVYDGSWSTAIEALETAIAEFSTIDAPFDLGWAWFMLAHARVRMDQIELAKEPEKKALEIFSAVGDISALALIFEMIAVIMLLGGDETLAAHFLGTAKRIKVDTGVALGDVELNRYERVDRFLADMDDTAQAHFEEGYNMALEESIDMGLAALT